MSFGTKLHEFMEAAIESPEQKLRRGTEDILAQVHAKWGLANEEVRGLFGISYEVDEMALYFPDRDLLTIFMSGAVQRGWVLFNYAEDNVTSRPIPGAYEVEYWFMRSPNVPYRLELMVAGEGFSPYHTSLHEGCQQRSSPVALAHASFKVQDEERFAATGVALRNAGLEVAQHCESSYGRFSYYITESGDKRNLPVIKPRINLRDQGSDNGN